MTSARFTVSLLAMLTFFMSQTQARVLSYNPLAEISKYKSYRIILDGSATTSSGTFDKDGAETTFAEGDSFSQMDFSGTLLYGYGKNYELGIAINGRSVSSKVNEVSASNSGVQSYKGIVRYQFKSPSKSQYTLHLEFGQAANSNNSFTPPSTAPTDEVNLGDEGSFYTAGLSYSYQRTKEHSFSLFAGYQVPGDNLSPEIAFSLETGWAWKKWGLVVGVEGVKSMNGDQYSDDPTLKPRQSFGPSALYNSVNREYMDAYGGLNYALNSRWRLGAYGGQRMSGVYTDNIAFAGLKIVYASSGVSREDEKIESFKEYNIEATIIKVSPRGKFVQIDQGISSDVSQGMRFDIYKTDFFGGNILVATGVAIEVGASKSIIKLLKKYKKTKVEKGYTARAK
ncbi:MAG: hypothetical protein GY909_09715 [Oligoflexia bacterium]|nr:hypothetical protein [Oligoflexia bacterium]